MDPAAIAQRYRDLRSRHRNSRDKAQRVRDILAGKLDTGFKNLVPPGEEPVVANLVASAARTMAQRVGAMPRLHAHSRLESDTAKSRAEAHEKALKERLELMNFPRLLKQGAYWLVAHGFLPFTLSWDRQLNQARVNIRDPLTAFPDTVWPHQTQAGDVLFALDMQMSQLRLVYPQAARVVESQSEEPIDKVKVGEYHTADAVHIAVIEPESVLIDSVPNRLGRPQVWIARDFTPDLDFHGQFDQVVPILLAQAKLMALLMSYTEQQVFAENIVIGEIESNQGDWAYGPNAVNVIRPQPNAGAQKLTNNASPQVFQEIDRLERGMRVAGNFPAAMSGEAASSVATGRGIEKLLEAPVDDNVGHYQDILSQALQDVFGAIPEFEKAHGKKDPKFASDVTVTPRFTAGVDPPTTVRLLQLQAAGVLSKRAVSDQLPEVDDPLRMERERTAESLDEVLQTQFMSQAEQGAIPPDEIVAIQRKLRDGKSFAEAYEEYIEEQRAAQEEGAPPPEPPAGPGGGGAQPLESLLGLSAEGEAMAGVRGAQGLGPGGP